MKSLEQKVLEFEGVVKKMGFPYCTFRCDDEFTISLFLNEEDKEDGISFLDVEVYVEAYIETVVLMDLKQASKLDRDKLFQVQKEVFRVFGSKTNQKKIKKEGE